MAGRGHILRAGLAAGLLMNVLGWIGNQLVLGPLWQDAIGAVVPLRSRTWINEIVSLVPDLIYGIAIAWLFAVLAETRGRGLGTALTAALVGLVASVPTGWLVWRWLRAREPGHER
jgi:membrane associated rhomboid family serine protease